MIALTVISACVAGIYPALKAARLSPRPSTGNRIRHSASHMSEAVKRSGCHDGDAAVGNERGHGRAASCRNEGCYDMRIKLAAAVGTIGLLGAFGAQSTFQAAAASPHVAHAHGSAAAGTSACRPAQLRLHNGRPVAERTQQETAIFVVRNSSAARCELDGYPVVSLVTAHGRVLPFRYRDHGDQMLTSAKPRPVVLASGGGAYFGINKNACVGRSTGTARYLAMFPLGQLQQRLRTYPVLGYCGGSDPGHVVDVSPIEMTVRAVLAHG